MEPTLGDVSGKKNKPSAEAEAAREFLKLASDRGLSLTGPDGLLKQFTKNVLETALDEEMTEHLGHEKHRAVDGRESTNVRNGSRPKTVLTAATGPVQIEVPRDRDGTFEPVIVKKRQRRLTEVDEVVLSLSARGLTTGEISAHFAQIYGAVVEKETYSGIAAGGGGGGVWGADGGGGGGLRLHRRNQGKGPRRSGRQPPDHRRDGGPPRWEGPTSADPR